MTLDFAPGYKTIAFAFVSVISFFGHSVSQEDMLQTVTAIGVVISNIGMAYGLIMKMYRSIKSDLAG